MNNSLRSEVAQLVKQSNHDYSGTPMSTMAGWGFMSVANEILALVKSKMPKMKPDPLSGHIADIEAATYNKCLAEVISILEGETDE